MDNRRVWFFSFLFFRFFYFHLSFSNFSFCITFDCMIDMTFPSSSDMIVMYLSNDRLKNRMKINYYTLPQSRSLMSDGINLKARIHNTVLSLNDTPFVSRAFENDVFFLFFFFFQINSKYNFFLILYSFSINDTNSFGLDANTILLNEYRL